MRPELPTDINRDDCHLRTIQHADKDIMLAMRNAPHVRKVMLDHNKISASGHDVWFESMMKDATKQFFVFEYKSKPEGIVGFFNVTNKSANWTLYLGREDSPKGMGFIMCSLALARFWASADSAELQTQVKLNNHASLSMHSKLGFCDISENKDGAIRTLRLQKKEWITDG